MAYDGNSLTNRVTSTGTDKLHAKVVDNVLSAPSYLSRMLGNGKRWESNGGENKITIKVSRDTQTEAVTGLETLNSAASDTTIQLSYTLTAVAHPEVSIMLESFSNVGAPINLDDFKHEEAGMELMQSMGSVVYSDGTGGYPVGLKSFVDDGTNASTIGGQSKSTYSVLQGTRTSSGGTLTLLKMQTLYDAISKAGVSNSEPNIGVTTKTIWSLYEQLLSPQVRQDYAAVGGRYMLVRGSEIKTGLGFGVSVLTFRGMPIMKDEFCTSGYLYMLNEKSFEWRGAPVVPSKYKDVLSKVDLGTTRVVEGTGAEAMNMPSEWNGFFHQKPMMLPNQAGMVGRFWLIGQTVVKEPRKNGVLIAITGI